MAADSPARMRAALIARELVEPLLARGDRYVRTPGGAKMYGQPIGSKIVADRRIPKGKLTALLKNSVPSLKNSGPILAYPDNERTPDGRVILTAKQLKDVTPDHGPHSIEKYLQDAYDAHGNKVKVLTKEREALHNEMVRKSLEGVQPTGKRRFINHGGGPASGKSTVTKRMPGYPKVRSYADYGKKPPGDAVIVEGDEYKKAMPEWPTLNENEAAGYTHEESSIIAKAVADAAMARGLDVVLDGTGNGSSAKMNAKIDDYRSKGYTVEGLYVTVPASEAIVRSLERTKTEGRYLSLRTLMNNHRGSTATVTGGSMEHYDVFNLWDTDNPFGVPPKPIVTDGKVVDEARWQAFKEKQTTTNLETAQDALRRAEAKQYEDVKGPDGRIVPAAEIRDYTISTIKRLIAHYEAQSSSQ